MNRIKPVIVLLVICIVATAALAYFNEITKDIIAEQQARAEVEALLEVMPGVDTQALTDDEVANAKSKITFSDETLDAAYKATKDGEFAGYIVKTSAKGYGGAVVVMTGIDNNGVITGTKVLSHSETAGLGAKAAVNGEGAWINQYVGKSAGNLEVVKTGNAASGEVDAITSATVTSKAVTRAVNIAGKVYEVLGGM